MIKYYSYNSGYLEYLVVFIASEGCRYMASPCPFIIELVHSISRDERDAPLTQYITNAGISRVRYTITHFKHHHRVLQLISNRISV